MRVYYRCIQLKYLSKVSRSMRRCGLPIENYMRDNYSRFKVFFASVCLFKLQIKNKILTTDFG